MRISTALLVRLYFIFSLLMLTVAACFNMQSMEGNDEGGNWELYTAFLAFMVWLAALLLPVLPGYDTYKPAPPILLYAAFLIWTVFPTLMSKQYSMAMSLFIITTPLLVLLSTYNTARHMGSHKWFIAAFCLMLLILSVQYFRVFNFFNLLDADAHLVSSYYTLYMLPLVFLCKKKTVRIVASLVVTVVIISSMKRSGVVALMAAIVVFIFVNQFVAKKLKASTIIGSFIALVLFVVLFLVMANMGEESVLERFENIGDDNGSGRLAVWEVTIKLISRLDFGSLLMGNGYNTVVTHSPFNLSAHNDFLEVIYDYGLIGLFLFVAAMLTTFFYALKMVVDKWPMAPSMAMLLTIFLIQSMISHIIIYYWASIYMLTCSYLIGAYVHDASK
jgi:O-antigen ligase